MPEPGEEFVRVPFIDQNGDVAWRMLSVVINPDDTPDSIRQRVNEAIEDYQNSTEDVSPDYLGDAGTLNDEFGNVLYEADVFDIPF